MTAGVRVVVVLLSAYDLDQLPQLREQVDEEVRFASLHGAGVPSLVRTLDELAAHGSRPVRLVCWSRSPRAERSWVGRVTSHWLRSGGTLDVSLGREVAHDVVALADLCRSASRSEGESRRVGEGEAPLTSAGWEDPPAFGHHVLVCRGPRCNAQGGDLVAQALSAQLAERGMLDSSVLVAQTGCLFPCNRSPVVVVNPGNRWFEHVTPEAVAGIVETMANESPPAFGVDHWVPITERAGA